MLDELAGDLELASTLPPVPSENSVATGLTGVSRATNDGWQRKSGRMDSAEGTGRQKSLHRAYLPLGEH